MNVLQTWFKQSKRDLPWRDHPTPYEVWVSEVMLQQTQVAVVIPYFLRWMELFPTIHALANASLDEVIKAWEGLGYYSRARNLHEGAKYVVENFGGKLPSTYEELNRIKGLGPYTIGAILSFAFHQRAVAVDGNVIRVLTRFLGIDADISKPKTQQLIREHVLKLLPAKEPWVVNEAFIELGATVCQKQPKCLECPLKKSCVAFQEGKTTQLPYKSTKTQYEKLQRTVLIATTENSVLLKRGEKGKIMRDLHEFPYFEDFLDEVDLQKSVKSQYNLDIKVKYALDKVSHSFTRYRVQLLPFVCEVKKRKPVNGFEWYSFQELDDLAFSSGHRRVLASANFKYL